MKLTTPVVFFIFKRPDLTRQVFDAIAQAKPSKLFIIADGARSPEEAKLCEETRSIVNDVDWDCDVFTDFSETNMRGPWRISSGLSWVFSQVEEAIILEDDCLPASSFFSFCQQLLEYYRHDERIMHISGNNFQCGQSRTNYSYYFSRYTHNWGWATWRRAWEHFDLRISLWKQFWEFSHFSSICDDPYEQDFWIDILSKIHDGRSVHWDGAWLFTCWSQGGLSILPNSNLVSNTGFRGDAEHNTNENSPIANLPVSNIWDIQHPPLVVRHHEADAFTFDYVFGGKQMKELVKQLQEQLSKTQEQLIQTQEQLASDNARIAQIEGQLSNVASQKEQLEVNLRKTENKTSQLQTQLGRSQEKQEKLRAKLEHYRELLKKSRESQRQQGEELQKQLRELAEKIASMESSKFWKMRNAWMKVKQKLGLDAN